MSNYYKSNTSPTGRILNPKGFIGLSEFQDADVEGKRKLANEYLADLRNAFLNSDEFADKNEALSSWKEDAEYVWGNVDSGWGERSVEAVKGLARSAVYGAMAVPAVVAHGGASLGSRIATTFSGGDEADRLYNQRQIDDALPSGAIFNEKISQIGTRIGDAFKTDNSRHDDFDVFMNASERYAIDKTEENLRLLNDAERKLLQSSADFNREDVKNYAHRSISQNNDVKNLLSLYLATNDPELRSEIKKHYILSLSDEGSQNRIERQKKRQLDYWGEDSVVGNEMATRLEYANPLDMAGTALGVGLAWKGAKTVVGGAKAAKTASFASRLGKGTKEFAKGVIAEAGTEIADTLVENPAATNKQLYEAGRSAFDQEALTFGIGTGVRAVQNRNRKEIQEQVDKIGALGDISGAGATSGAETASTETTSGGTTSGGESGTLTGSTTSTIGGKTTVETHTADDIVGATEAPTVPEGTPLGSIFWANVGGVDSAPVRLLFRNVDGVAVPLSKKEIEALSDEEVVAIYDAETGGDVSISDEQIEKVNEAAGTTEPTTETTPVETTPVETTPVETETDVAPVETETDVAPVESGTGEVVEKETAFTEPVEVYEWDNDSGDYVERAQADSHAYEDSRRNTIKRVTLTPEELLEEFNRERAKQAELNGRTYPGYAKERIEQTKANGKRKLDNLNKGEDSELYIRKSKNGFSICKGRKILKKFKSEQELETFLNQWALVAFEAHQRRSKLWLAVYNNDQKAIEKAVNSLTEDVYFDGIKLATGMPLDEAKSWVNQYASDMETDNYYIAEKREALDKREFDSDAKFIDWLLVYDRFFAKAFKDAEKTILDAIDYGWTTLSDKQKKSIGKDAGKAFVAEELNKWIATQLPKLKQRYGVKIKGETKAPKVDKNGQYELGFDAKKKGKKTAPKPKKTLTELVDSTNIEEKSFEKTKHLIPYSGAKRPKQRHPHEKLSLNEETKKVEELLENVHNVVAADGLKVNLRATEALRNDKGGWSKASLMIRARHLICREDGKGVAHNELDYDKLSWVRNIPETLCTAQAVYINEKGSKKTFAYVKNYEGTLHIVLVNQKGETFGHLVTQFPQIQNKPNAFLRGAYLWTTPKGLPIDSSQQAFLPKVKRGNISSFENQETQSENSAESQEKNSDNLNPDSSAKVVAPVSASSTASSTSTTASSTSTTAGATVSTAEEKASRSYAVLRKLASAVFKARKAVLSRKIYDGGRILPRGIKLDKTTNRLVGMCSIADIRRYISKAFELPISSGIRDGSKRMLGAYWNSLQAISMKSGHLNDIQSIAHELGHHLEMILFGYTLNGSKTDVEAELASYGREKFGDAYASSDLAREGFAELIADILNENPDVKTRCPIAYEVLRQALADNPVVSKVFNNIRQMIIINKDADAWAKLNANIRRKNDVERSPLVQKIQEFWEKALRALTDSLEGLDRLRKFLNEQKPGSGDKFWEHANNYRGGHLGQIDLCIKVHQVDIDGVVVGKSLLAIIKDNLKTAFDRENINAYLIARRCIEYYRANPKERTADCRKKFGIEYDVAVQVYNESTPGMRKCAEELDVYMRNNLKLLLDGKVISRKLYDKLIKNKGYVPMQRYMEAINESATSGSGRGFANVSSPIRSFFGSDREIIAGIDTIIEQTIQFREIAQKNRVALEVIQGISGGTATGNWATPARDKYSVTDVDLRKWAELVLTYKERTGEVEITTGDVRRQAIEEIIAELEAQIEADADLSLILKIYEKEAKEDKANGIITALNGNGEKVAWQIHDKGLYFALANLDPIGAQFWSTLAGRFLSFPTRALRAGATSAVGFVFANLIRDTQAATVLSNNKYRPWQSFTKGFLPSLVGKIPAVKRRAMAMKMAKEFLEANGELYDEWVASGGSMATSIDNTKARAEVTADELLADGFFGAWFARFKHSKVSTAMDAMLLPFETLAKVSEEMPRLAEYRNAREAEIKRLMKENGFTRAEAEAWWKSEKGSYARIKAANHSKSVTLNFSRSGWLSYHLNMVIPFFNAGMQGLDRFRTDLNPCDWRKLVTALYHLNLDEAKESVNKDNSVKFAKLVAIAGIVSALSWFSLRDDDDDDDAKDKIHDWRKRAYWNFQFGDTIITIPKSQELAPFCAVFEKMFNAVSGTKQDAGSDVLGNIWHVLVPSFRPQVINMYYELESGYSSFTEAPLESQSLKALPKFVRANATTSDTARYLAQVFHNYGIEVSPITLDAGISLAFSTLGRDVVGWIADPVVRTFGGMPDKMAYDWKETAFTKRFFVNEFTPSVYVKKFHDMAADCNRVRTLARYSEDGRVYLSSVSDSDVKKLDWYNGDYDGHPRYWHIRKVQEAMAVARADMIKIANDTTLSPKEKREKILAHRKFIDNVAKTAVQVLQKE